MNCFEKLSQSRGGTEGACAGRLWAEWPEILFFSLDSRIRGVVSSDFYLNKVSLLPSKPLTEPVVVHLNADNLSAVVVLPTQQSPSANELTF